MNLKDIIEAYKGNVFDLIPNAQIVSSAEEWFYYSSVKKNAITGVGWLPNDDIFFINGDGEYVFDILKKEIYYENVTADLEANFNEDYLSYIFQDEPISVFGLRGGDGTRMTRDHRWNLEIITLSWNAKIPKLKNCRTGSSYYLEMRQNFYEGYKFCGFLRSQNYFLLMGDGGIDIYKRGSEPVK